MHSSSLLRWFGPFCVFAAAACDCDGTRLGTVDRTTVVIETPDRDASAGWDETVPFRARAENPAGLSSLELLVGTDPLERCDTEDDFTLVCEGSFRPVDFEAHIEGSQLRLTARGSSLKGETVDAVVNLLIRRPPPVVSVVIDAPEPHEWADEDEFVEFRARATSVLGIRGMTLKAGDQLLTTCRGREVADETVTCEETFSLWYHVDDVQDGRLPLVAQASDRDGNIGEARLDFDVRQVESFISITSPQPGTTVSAAASVSFAAIAVNRLGVRSLALKVGNRELRLCDDPVPGLTAEEITERACDASFLPEQYGAQVVEGQLRLSAVATDIRGRVAERELLLQVEPLSVAFLTPPLTQQTPPVASVRGTGPVEVEVTSVSAINRVWIFLEEEQLGMFTAPPYRVEVDWHQKLGQVAATLRAVARDIDGNEGSAERVVQLGSCERDSECPSGQRCCVDTGTCHPIVGPGELCDCTRPCPEDQGCFPGTCGEPPRRCRPGCYLGNLNCNISTCTPSDRAGSCAPEDGKPAYCSSLPPAEQTEENMGGACAPADSCDAIRQDCPNLPLDRTQPVSATNPLRPHKCIPVSPNTNACVPEGPRRINERCGGGRCGDSAALEGCVKGSTCVVLYQGNTPVDVRCLRLCTRNSHCGFFETCQTLYGAGWEPYSTGVCR